MSSIKLYIATSLDGFIAREDGSVDWLDDLPNPNKLDYGYNDFIRSIDTVIMGRKTYDEVLDFDIDWPYKDCTSHIVSRNAGFQVSTDRTLVLHDLSKKALQEMKENAEKDIWLVGGGELVTAFLNLQAIDEMIIFFMPIILGSGLRLFPGSPAESKYTLVDSQAFETGVVMMTYRPKK